MKFQTFTKNKPIIMSDQYWMKEPCSHCPFRRDVIPFLSPERGEELAYHATNPYNSFPCHKTTSSDDDTRETYRSIKSKECAGFMALQLNECGQGPPIGFEPSDLVYSDTWEMINAYSDPSINPNAH